MASIAEMIVSEAQAQGVDPNLALSVAAAESGTSQSGCNPISSAGAEGVFQLMPSSFPGVDICDLATNIRTGVAYIKELSGKYGGDLQKVLAAYNWGPGNVDNAISAQGASWFSAIPSSVQGYANGIISAAGTAIQSAAAFVFPNSFSLAPSPTGSAVQPAVTAIGGSLLGILLLGFGAYLLISD